MDKPTKSAQECITLVELLRWRALHQGEQLAFTFLGDGETESVHLTYAELDRRARAIAVTLQGLCEQGDRVLLLYPADLEYIAAFFGCLYAGAIAVPAYLPRLNRPDSRLQAIVADAQAVVALTTPSVLSSVESRLTHIPSLDALKWLSTDEVSGILAKGWQAPEIDGSTLAFLQYTSGSTATPRGVMVGHGNLLYNLEMLKTWLVQSEQSVFVSWLPLFHDMGLIAMALQSVYAGARCVLMSPADFLQKPFRWLQAMSKYRGTTTGGPNFAYDLCARVVTVEERKTLDLSSWSRAINGAEPVRYQTLERFVEVFAPCGFRREALRPGYGLAEATVFVSGGASGETPVFYTVEEGAFEQNRVVSASEGVGRTLVGCGQAWLEENVVIVDPDSEIRCSSDMMGEIWVSGPNIAQGYWNRPEATEHTFCARLADTGAGPFLRTGDLGFVHAGQLYITGRIKDLIIIHGRNHYPQDIELTVEQSHPALRPGCGAAFSVEIGVEERLVIIQEVKRSFLRNLDVDAVVDSVRQAVMEEHEVDVYAVTLLRTGSILKTSSGKIQRRACRTRFLERTLNVVGEWVQSPTDFESYLFLDEERGPEQASAAHKHSFGDQRVMSCDEIRRVIADTWAEVLGVEKIGVHDDFFDWGANSLLAIRMVNRLRQIFKIDLSLRVLFESPTVAGLAEQIELIYRAAREDDQDFLESGPESVIFTVPAIASIPRNRNFPPSFSQEQLWFLSQLVPDSPFYNIPVTVHLTGPLDVAVLERVFNEIVKRHEILRTTFGMEDGSPVQVIASSRITEMPVIDLEGLSDEERKVEARYLAMKDALQTFDLVQGALLRIRLLRLGVEDHTLLLTMHHTVSDGWSMSVLMREVATLYDAFSRCKPSPLPELPIQYADFALWQREWLRGEVLEEKIAYWRAHLAGMPNVLDLSSDRPRPSTPTFRGASEPFALSPDLMVAIQTLGRQEGVTLFMVLLAAFDVLLYRYTGQEDLVVGTPIANRNWEEVEGLIGVFVNTLVLRVNLSGNPTFREVLGRVREVTLGAYAHRDLPFEVVVQILQPKRAMSHLPLVQVGLTLQNFPIETFEVSGLTLNPMEITTFESGGGVSRCDLEFLLWESAGGLAGSMVYNTDMFEPSTVIQILNHFNVLLRQVVACPERRLLEILRDETPSAKKVPLSCKFEAEEFDFSAM